MNWNRYLIAPLVLCIAYLIFTILQYDKVKDQNEELQKANDALFKVQLNNALSSFEMEVNDYTYRSMLANVSNAAVLSELTTFEQANDDLDISLNNLYIALREDKSKDLTLARIDELRNIFTMLVRNPASKTATERMNWITDETFFDNKNE